MNIAIDVREAYGQRNGKGTYTFHLINQLIKLDKKNNYTLFTREEIPEFSHYPNVEQITITLPGIFWHIRALWDVVFNNIDTFFAPTSFIIPALLPRRIRTIVTIHDLVSILSPQQHNKKAVFIEKILMKWVLKRSDIILSVSQNTANDIKSIFNLRDGKIAIVSCAADKDFRVIEEDKLKEWLESKKLPPKFFLSVGTLCPRKNQLRTIRAFKRFRKTYPDYHLVIVGNRGWQYQKILEEVRILDLQNYVHFYAYTPSKDLVKLYNSAIALVFPSIYEGFGIPLLEAMQSGCPIISSNTSSMPEVVGESGLLVNPEDIAAICEAMVKISQNTELAHALVNKGFEQAKKFSWENSAKELLALINKK